VNQYPADSAGQPPAQPSPGPVRLSLPTSVPYVTYTIVAITGLVYLLQLGSVAMFGYANAASQMDWLEAYGARINELLRAGEVWRFLTPVLLHASVPHILFNMYALIVFGAGLERNFGHARFLVLYLLGGFTGNVLSFLLSSGYSVGASTAIFGLVGAEGIFLVQNRGLFGAQFGRAIGNVLFIVAVNLFLGLTPGIDNWGHVGGLLGGLVFTWFAGPVWEVRQGASFSGTMPALYLADRREAREVLTGAATVILIFGALAAWGMIAQITP
jgi:rhomboid protease GluP